MRIFFYFEIVTAYILYYCGLFWIRKKYLEKHGAGITLVYHRIGRGKGSPGEIVNEESLDWQMRYIKNNFTPTNWEGLLLSKESSPKINILVTFDDGYKDNFTKALPILEKHHIPAVFFTPTNMIFKKKIIKENSKEKNDKDIFPLMSNLTSALKSKYVSFGNHTVSHPIFSSQSTENFKKELRISQKEFEEKLGIKPDVFAFPRGRKKDIPQAANNILKNENIKAAFTMVPGLMDNNTNKYYIPRIGVSHINNKVVFKTKILGMLITFIKLRNALNL